MYVSLNWLKDFVELPKGISPKELAKILTLKTAETEGAKTSGAGFEGVVIGELLKIKKHPNADKLHVAKVDIGKDKPIQLCFGEMAEMKVGFRVPVAVAPTSLPTGMKILKRDLRGVMSEGMLCLDQELGLKEEGVSIQFFPKVKPGTPLAEVLGLDNAVIEFNNKALTHRPDLWGTYGIAREISTIYKLPLKKFDPKPKIPAKGEKINVTIKNYNLCHRYCGVIIKNIKVQPSPEWMQKRLKATGHQCYNNIVDVTNYISEEIGKPIHAFDRKFIKDEIIVRNAVKGEGILALDGKIYILDPDMLVIADKEKAVAIGGIIGGNNSSVKEKTTEIIIESAAFNGANIRRTATKLGLRTDAVQKFEKELDPTLPLTSMLRAIELILQVSPDAVVAGPITDNHKFDEKLKTIELSITRICSKIGVKISKKEIIDILERLHFKVSASSGDLLSVTIPSFRAQKDVSMEDDLIEEIARIYGYDEIPAVLPNLPTRLPIENEERVAKHNLRKLLSLGLGLDEISTYSFYSKNDLEKCRLEEKGHIFIENYLSEDQTHMRLSLIPNLLSKTVLNFKYFNNFKIYEIGRTYKNISEYFPLEEKWIAGIIATKDAKTLANQLHSSDPAFYETKSVIEEILKSFKVPFYKITKGSRLSYTHPVKSATILSPKGETLGSIFTIHPAVLKNYDLEKTTIAAFELNLSALVKLEKKIVKFKELSRFPNIEFDISVVVNEKTEIGEIEFAIQKADKQLIQNIKLFDLYKGENIGQDKKAVAFKITLGALDRTLTDSEMLAVQKKIFENLKALGGIIRGT